MAWIIHNRLKVHHSSLKLTKEEMRLKKDKTISINTGIFRYTGIFWVPACAGMTKMSTKYPLLKLDRSEYFYYSN